MSKKDKKNKNKGNQTAPQTVGNTALKPQPEVGVVGPISTSKFMEGVTELVPGAVLPFKGDSEILPALKEELEADKTAAPSGTPLTTPVKLETNPKVLTSATKEKEQVKPVVAPAVEVPKAVKQERGKTVVGGVITEAMKKLTGLFKKVDDGGYSQLKADDDTFVLSEKDANIIKARIQHLRKALTSTAEYMTDAGYNHFTARNKILELHFVAEIRREEHYLVRYSK
jgi:hypothetical protein